MVEFPYCPQNELVATRFFSKFHQFINQKFYVTIKWTTKKIKHLFSLKNKNPYPACQIYKETCVCDEIYIGETIWNVDIRWNEHDDIRKESEPAKYLKENLTTGLNRKPFSRLLKTNDSETISKLLLSLLWDKH